MVIWKYKLKVQDTQRIEIPSIFKILTVQMQDGEPTMWVQVDESYAKQTQTIYMANTGSKNNIQFYYTHIGTVQDNMGLVWHYFFNPEKI